MFIDEIEIPDTQWYSEWDCAKSDLGCLHNEESLALADKDWNVILLHTWVFSCVGAQKWYKKV